jgi:SpoVK/Ycf46/Vps4 family AAA+-type ATPase
MSDQDASAEQQLAVQRMTTPLAWEDLVLDARVRGEIEMITRWVRHSETLLEDWGLARRLKPGYRSLFYGPPGTGKTLAVCLLGQVSGLAVYRIDLARVVSGWIGETEKDLAKLFDQAAAQGGILLFDEADALFGKRTESRSANDRAINQQVAYLLQRIEDYPGIVILETNLRSRMDEAFIRRFQSVIHFAMPDAEQRLRLWRGLFDGAGFALAADVDLPRLAADHELAGGSIVNVLRHAALLAVERNPPMGSAEDLHQAILLELRKEEP